MARSSEDALLIVDHVKNKKCEGTMYMMGERMAWMPQTKTTFTISHNYADIKSQKISPDTKDKVQLQIVFHDGGANTFLFVNPAGRDKQKSDRDGIKELLQQLLPKFRNKVSSELEEKNRLLQDVPELFQLYKDLVVTNIITPDEFWANHAPKKFANTQKAGVSAAFLAEVRPQSDGCNGLRYNLTADIINSIFETYPTVRQKHLDNVPHKMSEQEFWTKFFQSHYFYRDQVALNSKDVFADCVKDDDETMHKEIAEVERDPLLDIIGLSDNTCGDGYGLSASDSSVSEQSKSTNVNAAIIKRFNQHSSRVLHTCLKRTASSVAVAASNGAADETTNGSGRSSVVSDYLLDDEIPAKKRSKISEKIEYKDLQADSGTSSGAKLNLMQLDCYLQGPTTETITSYETSDDISEACHALGQEILTWQPCLTRAAAPANALSALGDLTPGGMLMKGSRHQVSSDLPREDLKKELQQLYVTICELLRHFWMCFPVTNKTLEEKVIKMRSTLERFQTARIAAFRQKLIDAHMSTDCTIHLEQMLSKAYEKFNIWQARKLKK